MVKGYKVFNPDWTCRDKQYTCPGKFEEDGKIGLCEHGMHFCENLNSCFNYYRGATSEFHFAEVVAYGDVETNGDKSCTNKLEIVREIPYDEVLRLSNTGVNNTGLVNSGNWNTGDWNTGNCNTGNCNTGDCNTGDCNTGNCNTGDWNTGDWNTGNWNTGDWNTGDWNTGDWNTGDWNTTSHSTGVFNTEEQTIRLFNSDSDYTYEAWLSSRAKRIMDDCPATIVEWIWSDNMTDEEKASHPEYETTGGYLKVYDVSETRQIWWNGISQLCKNYILSLPNFDAEIFKKCTGIDINAN